MRVVRAGPVTLPKTLKIGLRPIVAFGQFHMPASFAVLEFDMGGIAGDALFSFYDLGSRYAAIKK